MSGWSWNCGAIDSVLISNIIIIYEGASSRTSSTPLGSSRARPHVYKVHGTTDIISQRDSDHETTAEHLSVSESSFSSITTSDHSPRSVLGHYHHGIRDREPRHNFCQRRCVNLSGHLYARYSPRFWKVRGEYLAYR